MIELIHYHKEVIIKKRKNDILTFIIIIIIIIIFKFCVHMQASGLMTDVPLMRQCIRC